MGGVCFCRLVRGIGSVGGFCLEKCAGLQGSSGNACLGVLRRGHDSTTADHHGEPWAFIVAVAERYTFRRDWHEDECVSGLVRHYQAALDGVLAADPWLEKCVRSCSHCGIRFLTHPRNVWRDVLRCPFGCRQEHRRQRASARSTAYYQTDSGKGKKKKLNCRRSERATVSSGNQPASPNDAPRVPSPPENHAAPEHATHDSATTHEPEPATEPATQPATVTASSISRGHESQTAVADPAEHEHPEAVAELRVAGVVLDEARVARSPVLPYVRMVASLIEGRNIGLPELIQALQNAVRQHSISRRRRVDYVMHYLNQHPP